MGKRYKQGVPKCKKTKEREREKGERSIKLEWEKKENQNKRANIFGELLVLKSAT